MLSEINIPHNTKKQEKKELTAKCKIKIDELDKSDLYELLDQETDTLAFGEGDMELIRLCADRLDEINGGSLIDEKTVEEIIESTKAEYITVVSDRVPVRKRSILRRAVIIAAATFAVMISSVMIAGAFGFDVSEHIRNMVFEPEGTAVNFDNVTLFHSGNGTEYDSIEKLIKSENLDIMYPTKFPEGYNIKYIQKTKSIKGNEAIEIFTNDPFVGVTIELEYKFYSDSNTNVYECDGISYRYILENEVFYATSCYEGNTYYFKAHTFEDLVLIINNMTE